MKARTLVLAALSVSLTNITTDSIQSKATQ